MCWATVQVNVLLNSFALGAIRLLAAAVSATALIQRFRDHAGDLVGKDLDDWGQSIQEHRQDQGWCNHDVPLLSQIGEGTILHSREPRQPNDLRQVSIGQQEQNTSIEEGRNVN